MIGSANAPRRAAPRRAGRSLHRSALAAAAISVAMSLTGCVTDQSSRTVPAPPTGPDGPACRAGSALSDQMVDGMRSEPTAVLTALEDLGRELPDELRGFVDLLLSGEDVEAPNGAGGYATAWRTLEAWSQSVCERPLLPASLDQPDLSWIPDTDWRDPTGPGDATTSSTGDTDDPDADSATAPAPGDDGPPPSFDDLVAVLASATGGDVPWYTGQVTGMVGRSVIGTSISVDGVETAALALAACDDLMALVDGGDADVVVRGVEGELLALTDQDGCRTALGS